MKYSVLDECMQALFDEYVPLSPAQRQRLGQFCTCVLLAGSSHLPQLARWLGRQAQQGSRERWLRRLLDAPFVSQELVYEPWVKNALQPYRPACWHVVLDRTQWLPEVDLVMVALSYGKRAIPLKWQQVPYGGASTQTYIDLLKHCQPLIPSNVRVVVHGDAEFGAIPMLQFVQQQGWDFILGQRCHYQCRFLGQANWYALADFALDKRQGLYLERMVLTKEHQYPSVNIFGFLQADTSGVYEPRYYATSLPITHTLRRIGRRRWGIECCFQDYKSSGWEVDGSHLQDAAARNRLLVLLSTCYVWATCIGRWLCKSGARRLIDAHPQRQFSFFRIGWDWLVYQFRQQQPIPHLLTLYS